MTQNIFPNKSFKKAAYFSFSFFITTLIFSTGCEDESSNIGLDLLPDKDKIQTYSSDTLTLRAFTLGSDSVVSNDPVFNLWGSYCDPVFGKKKAEFLTQASLKNALSTFGNNAQVDSVILYLRYYNTYGSSLREQKLHVYRLTEEIFPDSIYYSNLNIDNYYDPVDLADYTFTPKPRPEIDTIINIAAIPLSNSLAESFFSADTGTFTDNDKFQDFFKGLYIATDQVEEGGSIISFDLLSNDSKLTIYFNQPNVDSLKYSVIFSIQGARINLFQHDYFSSDFYSNLNDTTQQDSVIYLQASGGVQANIKIPFLRNFRDLGNIAINEASLILKVDSTDITFADYEVPAKFLLYYSDEEKINRFLPDYYISPDYYGGKYNLKDNTISFTITQFIQQYVNRFVNINELYLIAGNNSHTANRVVLTSGKHSNPLTLRITYTKL